MTDALLVLAGPLAAFALLALIPNTLTGRLSFVGCGVIVLVIGGLLVAASRKKSTL